MTSIAAEIGCNGDHLSFLSFGGRADDDQWHCAPRLSRLVVVRSEEYQIGAVHAPGYGPGGTGPMKLAQALQYPLCLPSVALAEVLGVRVNPKVRISTNSITALIAYLRDGKGIGLLTWPMSATRSRGNGWSFVRSTAAA